MGKATAYAVSARALGARGGLWRRMAGTGARTIGAAGGVGSTGTGRIGVHLRIAEVLPDPGAASYRIRHILEQGYLRPDGGAVRPAVVVVAGSKQDARGESPPSGSVAPETPRIDPPTGPSPRGDLS